MNLQTITLAGGCFWCLEAVFQQVKGVAKVESGYANGEIPNPDYETVCSGRSGYAEVVQVSFDPDAIKLGDLLSIFFAIHDPTTLNRQGNDVGTQYRSGIYYSDDVQKLIAEQVIATVREANLWGAPMVTELELLQSYYPAEAYHQNYFENNPGQGYCAFVVAPKVAKFRQKFSEYLIR